MNKKHHLLLGMVAVLAAATSLTVQASHHCGLKIKKIEQQMAYAKAHGNPHRLRGLQRALVNVQARCGVVKPSVTETQAALSTEQARRERDIATQVLVVERQSIALQQALQEGDLQQSAYQRLLLEQAEAKLAALRAQEALH